MQSEEATEPVTAKNFPGSHDTQWLSRTVNTNTLPAAQTVVQLSPVSDEYKPSAQSVQSEAAAEPATARNLPFSHPMHMVEPVCDEYFPAEHNKQLEAPAMAEYFPASQTMQSEGCRDSVSGQNLPAVHMLHASEPTDGVKVPTAHTAQLREPTIE